MASSAQSMPQRPESHRSETAAVTAFASAIDSLGWTFQPGAQGADYGIDGEVEVFDGDHATGLTFKVQIKGKKTIKKKRSASVSISVTTLNYWSALGIPVMLACYIRSENALYVRWVHNYDLGPDGDNLKSKTIKFTEGDRFENRSTSLGAEVARLRHLQRDSFIRPIPILLKSADPQLLAHALDGMRKSIRKGALEDLLRPSATSNELESIAITISADLVSVAMPLNAGSVNLHTAVSPQRPDIWSREVTFGLGVLLEGLGSSSDAHRLMSAAGPDSGVAREIFGTTALVSASMTVRNPALLVSLLISELRRSDLALAGPWQFYLMGLVELAELIDDSTLSILFDTIGEASTRITSSDPRLSARLLHNAATLFMNAKDYERGRDLAIRCLSVPSGGYEGRHEIRQVAAQCSWHLKDLPAAETWYGEVAAMRPGMDSTVSLSDAIAHQGRYAEARDMLIEAIQDAESIPHRLTVWLIALDAIVHEWKLDAQDRAPLSEDEFLALPKTDDAVGNAIRDRDALSAPLWASLHDLPEPVTITSIIARGFLSQQPGWLALAYIAAWDPHAPVAWRDSVLDVAMRADPDIPELIRSMLEAVGDTLPVPVAEIQEHIVKFIIEHEPDHREKPTISVFDGEDRLD